MVDSSIPLLGEIGCKTYQNEPHKASYSVCMSRAEEAAATATPKTDHMCPRRPS